LRGAIIAVIGLAACSGKGGDKGDASSGYASGGDAAPPSDETAATSGSADTALTDNTPPTWLLVTGEVTVLDGVPDPLTSVIRLAGLDADQLVLCEVEAAPLAFEPVEPPPAGLLGWWDIAIPEAKTCLLSTVVRLGIGPYDALLDPALDAAGISGTPYGMYTPSPEDELWIFGVAGTPANFTGAEPPVTEEPLPDGPYRLESLVLLPI